MLCWHAYWSCLYRFHPLLSRRLVILVIPTTWWFDLFLVRCEFIPAPHQVHDLKLTNSDLTTENHWVRPPPRCSAYDPEMLLSPAEATECKTGRPTGNLVASGPAVSVCDAGLPSCTVSSQDSSRGAFISCLNDGNHRGWQSSASWTIRDLNTNVANLTQTLHSADRINNLLHDENYNLTQANDALVYMPPDSARNKD